MTPKEHANCLFDSYYSKMVFSYVGQDLEEVIVYIISTMIDVIIKEFKELDNTDGYANSRIEYYEAVKNELQNKLT